MLKKLGKSFKKAGKNSANFFIPSKVEKQPVINIMPSEVATIIPTYKPNKHSFELIRSIKQFHPNLLILVVDDFTPTDPVNSEWVKKIKDFASKYHNVLYIRTPENQMKAGALNFGINHLKSLPKAKRLKVVVIFDDDVDINEHTIPELVSELYSHHEIGAVCSTALVKNKNENLLTRLQSLEYHSFNVTKIADNGFFQGPLVMQGMLTAFKWYALKQVKGFTHNHLIEDYEITAKLKNRGWKVKMAQHAIAYTVVPNNFADLWRQRVRWGYGGIQVVKSHIKNPISILQDIIGHAFFLSLLTLIIVSLLVGKNEGINSMIFILIVGVSVLNFLVSYFFNAFIFILYPQKDRTDAVIRFTILPEFFYSNVLSLVLIGSYIFFIFNVIESRATKRISRMQKSFDLAHSIFRKVGYSNKWGTRQM